MKKQKKILLTILGIVLLLIFSACGTKFSGGPVDKNTEKKVTKTIQSIFKKHQLDGTVTVERVEHNGFSLMGILTRYRYTEVVNGLDVSILGIQHHAFDDDGELINQTPEVDLDTSFFTEIIKESSLQQPMVKKYQNNIQKEFQKFTTDQLRFKNTTGISTISSGVNMFLSSYDSYTEETEPQESRWFKEQVAENLASGLPEKMAFKGYYHFSPKELLSRGLVTVEVGFTYTDKTKQNEKINHESIHQIIDGILLEINTSNFPEGKYTIGFDVKGTDGTSGSIRDTKFFKVKNGMIIAQSSWGENVIIEGWNPE